MKPDWPRLRKDFPITERWTYLDHAAAGPIPRPVYSSSGCTPSGQKFPNSIYSGTVLRSIIEPSLSIFIELGNFCLQEIGLEIVSPLERQYKSGITVFKLVGAAKVVRALLRRRIFVSARGEGVRVAPHFYNTHKEIDRFIHNLRSLI